MKRIAAILLLFPSVLWAHSDDYLPTARGAVDQRPVGMPERNSLYSCDAGNMGVPALRPWVAGDGRIDFDKKPVVPGDAIWNGSLNVRGNIITGNGLPSHPTGEFPIKDASVMRYDANPNSIREQHLSFDLPRNPQIADKPSCLGKGAIGIMLTGAALFSALDADNRDAVATEIFDKCEGHPERGGTYHYHHYSPCFDTSGPDMPSPLLGYALDGFGIYGPRGDKGHLIANAELDECHGINSAVPDGKGGSKTVYHYVLNNEFPYSLGCYKGTPVEQHPAMPARHEAMHEPPDLRIAAMKLGISVEELRDALGPPPPDIRHAAKVLGIHSEDLRDALGPPP